MRAYIGNIQTDIEFYICVPILPNQTHVKIFKNDIFAFYVSIHPYETEKKVW